MGRIRLFAIGLTTLLALVGIAVPLQEPARQMLLTRRAGQPLDEAESAALARCEDPGWTALSRVLEQDLAVDCSELWFAEAVSAHLGPSEARWIEARVDRPSGTSRQRFRIATALLLGARTVPVEWPFLVTDVDVGPGTRAEVLSAVLSGHLPQEALDPVLVEDLDRARFLEGDGDGLEGVIRTLRRYAARPERASADERAAWSTQALSSLGLPGNRLEVLLERQRQGLSWQGTPEHLVPLLANRGAQCAERGSPECLTLVADLLDANRSAGIEGFDGGPGGELPPIAAPPRAVRALTEVLTADRGAVLVTAESFAATSAWIAEASPEDRSVRLLGSVAWPGSGWGVAQARAGIVGDPLDVLVARGGSPWAVAVAAAALGEATGVPVAVYAAGDGVRIVAGEREIYVGPCGGLVGLRAGRGAPWPVEAVVAQAALEAAGGALRAGRGAEAVRMAVFAERLDPIGARGASDAIAGVRGPVDAEADLGRVAAVRLTTAPVGSLVGAEEERAARPMAWSDLATAWGHGPDPAACPALLGP